MSERHHSLAKTLLLLARTFRPAAHYYSPRTYTQLQRQESSAEIARWSAQKKVQLTFILCLLASPHISIYHHTMGIKRSRRDSVSSEESSTPYSREQSVDIKFVHLDSESALSCQPAVMRCSLPPHEPLSFDSFEAYDVHYQKTHMNRCSECQKNFPDEHFLHLHIAENHDPINAAKRDKGEKIVGQFVDVFSTLF